MKILKYLFERHKTKKLLKNNVEYERDKYEDRNVLESIIFPYLISQFNPKKILDIGREDYQQFYNEFFSGRELWTIDIDPKMKEFGSKNHIVDSAVNIKNHFQSNYFDCILMNGVFGWGLNDQDDIQKTFNGIYDILKPGGIFIFGWNNIEDLTPVPLKKIKALNKFKPLNFKPLKGKSFKCLNGEHTYNFYIK